MNADAPLAHDDRGTGEVVLFLHGHPFDRRMWAPQVAALAPELRVVAPDLPGYGASPPRATTITMRELAAAAIELLDHLRIARATVVGLSMGGLVAMELGLGWPERVDGLVLAATTAAAVTEAEAEHRRRLADRVEAQGPLTLVVEMADRLFGPVGRRDPELLRTVIDMMISTPPAGAAAALRGRAQRPDYATLLGGLTVPALVIAGRHDGFAPDAVTDQLVAALPDPEVLHLERSGHLPNLEEPDAFTAAVRSFVARTSSPPR
jgi:pimeloyl-ACP methyl ester carboxylesterase